MKKILKNIIFSILIASFFAPIVSFAEEGWYMVGVENGPYKNVVIGKDGQSFLWGKQDNIPGFATEKECSDTLKKYYDEYYAEEKEILGDKAPPEDRTTIKCEEYYTAKETIDKKQNAKPLDVNTRTDEDETYTLLAPFGSKLTEVRDGEGLSKYLNQMFFIAIGLAGALAVVMIVINGILYMGDESVFGKTRARQRIVMAIGGLILALGAWVLLRTINPDLVGGNLSIGQVTVKISGDEKNFSIFESNSKTNPGFKLSGTFSNPKTSSGVDSCVEKLKNGDKIVRLTAYENKRMGIVLTKGSCATVDVAFGQLGQSAEGKGVEGDKKTPKGSHTIGQDRMDIATSANTAIYTRPNSKGQTFNLGPAMFTLSIDGKSTSRGIGIHGSAENVLRGTNGCIRMRNDDLLALAPYIKRDRPMVIVK